MKKSEPVWREDQLNMHYHNNEFNWEALITGLAVGLVVGFTLGLMAWTHLPG